MNILGCVKKIPGGLMIVPMFVTALINTFFPEALKLGGPTSLFTAKGTMVVIGLILFITGSQFRLNQLGMTLKRGAALCLAKLAIGFLAGWLVLSWFGLDGFWGISAVALISAMGSALTAGMAGILLTLIFLIVNVALMLLVDRAILRRPGYAAVSTCSVAGISVVVPTILAASQPAFAPCAEAATSQLALVMVLSPFAIPWITSQVVKRWGRG